MKYHALIVSTCAVLMFFSGCAEQQPVTTLETVQYNKLSLRNYALGRHYLLRGRYELARDSFLQALATAQERDMIEQLTRELESTDRLIVSQR